MLVIPTQQILPSELHDNIVINIAEMRFVLCIFAITKSVYFSNWDWSGRLEHQSELLKLLGK